MAKALNVMIRGVSVENLVVEDRKEKEHIVTCKNAHKTFEHAN